MLKIDIENAEIDFFNLGVEEWLDDVESIVIELNAELDSLQILRAEDSQSSYGYRNQSAYLSELGPLQPHRNIVVRCRTKIAFQQDIELAIFPASTQEPHTRISTDVK